MRKLFYPFTTILWMSVAPSAILADVVVSEPAASGIFGTPQLAKPQAGKIYQLVNRYSGKCLDVRDHSKSSGGTLQQWACTGGANQKFLLVEGRGFYTLVAQESGLTLSLKDNGKDNGNLVIQSESSSPSVRLNVNASANNAQTISFQSSNKCLDIAGPSADSGAVAQQWNCHGGVNQDFFFVEQSAQSGKIAWEQASSGIQSDKFGRVLRSEYKNNNNGISLVDIKTGKSLWTYPGSGYEYAATDCSDESLIYMGGTGKVRGISAADGRVLWTNDTGRDNTSLSCADKSLYATAPQNGGFIRAIEKATGKTRWEYQGKEPNLSFGYLGKSSKTVLLSQYANDGQVLVGLSNSDGKELWKKSLSNGEWAYSDNFGNLFVRASDNSVRKLSTENGQVLWSIPSKSSDYATIESAGKDLLYVRQGSELSRISAETGKNIWTITLPTDGNGAYSQITKNGDVFIRIANANQASYRYVRADGSTAWTQSYGSETSLFEDQAGVLILRAPNQVALLDRSNGKQFWTFSREFPLSNQTLFDIRTTEKDVYVTYGSPSGKFPAMGLIRLDRSTGALQWDFWANETVGIQSIVNDYVLTVGAMGSRTRTYTR